MDRLSINSQSIISKTARDTSYIDEEVPINEGEELLDCDGDEVDPEVILNMLTTPLITDS